MPGATSDARLSQDGPAISGIPRTAIANITAQKVVGIIINLPFVSSEEKRASDPAAPVEAGTLSRKIFWRPAVFSDFS
jgi:hypothetical protein